MRRFFIALVILAFVSFNSTLLASYAYYVGKKHTSDNTVLIGGTGEEVSGHWLEVVPQRLHEPGSKIKVGVNEKANYPGKITEIPQSAKTHRYLGMFYSDYLGFPAPLINGGLNEHGVAARDVWATSRSELRKMTVTPQTGPSYSDLSRIAMERATSAKEAARIVGELIDRYSYSTYGGNSHLFADADEGWILIEMAGSKGLWVAERLGPDDVRVLYPGYIGDIPKNYLKNPNYMGSKNLISFAIEQGWYDPDSNRPFNVAEVYLSQPEGGSYKFVTPRMIEKEFLNMSPDVSVRDMMAMVRDPRICDEEAGYGQVARLVKRKNGICHLLWIAPTGSVTAPFIP
ncbi:MAG: C69 family dipeptidase, partial [Candidatus Rifleibacteriota bacterium]